MSSCFCAFNIATLYYKLVLTPGLPFDQNDLFLHEIKSYYLSAATLAHANFIMCVSISLWLFKGHWLINFDLISNIIKMLKQSGTYSLIHGFLQHMQDLKHFEDRIFASAYWFM